MPIFTAIAAGVTAIAGAIGFSAAVAAGIGTVAAFAARTLLTVGITKLLVNRSGKTASGSSNAGARIQLPPATDNKLPVVYGSAFIGGIVTDAKMSSDQKTMWYVLTLAEHTDTTAGSGYTFGDIYYNGKLVTFGTGGDAAKVVSLSTNEATPQIDTKIAGNLYMYLFTNGSSSGVNTGGQTAIQILQDSAIPVAQRWTATDLMSNAAFMIVKVVYNQDAGTTNIGTIKVQLENSLYEPGSVLKDYLTNDRYGCAIPLARIDTASLTDLDTYSQELIDYKPVGWNPGDPYSQQERYRVDGPINTGNDCLSNLQQLVDACDSWLQYSELTGQWKVVINKAYDQAPNAETLGNLFEVNSDNLVGGIEVNPIDLNSMYNEVEVQYPNYNITDQTDYQFISLWDDYPSLLSPNEPINKLTIQLPIVNNAVQAKYLALRRLIQGREDLVISFATDYSGIQVTAGDVIKVTLSQYGWTDKLFRVTYVGEQKYPDGSLGATMTAFEYNSTVYDDDPLHDYVPEQNTGLSDPNIIGAPIAPTINLDVANTINQMTVTGTVPSPGTILFMDFNYGNSSNSATHQFYTSISQSNGTPFTSGSTVSINSTNLPAGNVYWSVTARNQSVGVRGPASAVTVWPGSNVTVWDGNSNSGGITNNNIANSTIANYKLANSGVSAGTYYNATVTVTKEGLLTYAANGNSTVVTTYLGGINFEINSSGNVILPVDAQTDPTRNVPIYFYGTGVDENNIFPWAQGTANANPGTDGNNYYGATSTSAYTPYNTSGLFINDGNDNWYKVAYDNSMAGQLDPGDTYLMSFGIQLLSDTNGTIVQIVPGLDFSTSDYECIADSMTTLVLFKNQPQLYEERISKTGTPIPNLVSSGVFVRCVTDGANLTITRGTVSSSKSKNFP